MPVVSAGEVFPNLTFETYTNSVHTVDEAVKHKRHTVFWVMRFIGCRFCQYDIDGLAQEYANFTDKDTQVFVVLQSSRESITGLKGDWKIPFDIICDTQHRFYQALNIRTTPTKEDRMPKNEAGLLKLKEKQVAVSAQRYERRTGEGEAQQLPALFIVGPDRNIEYAHYAVNSIDIPDFSEILAIIDHLNV